MVAIALLNVIYNFSLRIYEKLEAQNSKFTFIVEISNIKNALIGL
jgi:hypothetical protein